jgi:hypothetical protein
MYDNKNLLPKSVHEIIIRDVFFMWPRWEEERKREKRDRRRTGDL